MNYGIASRVIPVVAALVAGSLAADPAASQALIDAELDGQVDFRNEAYQVCLGKTDCTVDGLQIRAERRTADGTSWYPVEIYWDMVDGLGVQDGAQNDEIDFDERIFVTFPSPRSVSKIWLSDLFRQEDKRYGSSNTDYVEGVDVDTESAGLQLLLYGETLNTYLVEADDRLPWASFNQEITWEFKAEGDLRRRVIIVDDVVRIVAPGADGSTRINFEQITIGEIDPEKKSIFEGVETVEIDLSDILAEFNGTELFAVGTRNFELVRSLTEDPETLAGLRRIAEKKRTFLKMSNGEVGWTFETPVLSDTVSFFAPFDSSNDFSIAGIITE